MASRAKKNDIPKWKMHTLIWSFVALFIFTIAARWLEISQNIVVIIDGLYLFIILSIMLPDLRKQWEQPPKEQKVSTARAFWQFIFTAFFAVLMGLVLVYMLGIVLVDVLGVFMDRPLAILFVFLAIGSIMFAYVLLAPIYSWHIWRKSVGIESKVRPWVYAAIASIVVFVAVGVIYIGLTYNNEISTINAFNIGLDDAEDQIELQVICESHTDSIIMSGERTRCRYSNGTYEIVNSTVTYYLEDGSIIVRDFSNLEIYPPKDLTHISFHIPVVVGENKTRVLSNGANYQFATREDLRRQREGIEKSLLGLLAIAFLTIPLAIKNISELWER